MNLFLMVFLIPSGSYLKLMVYLCLQIWAVLHVSIIAEAQLRENPQTMGLTAIEPIIKWINLSKVEVATIKNQLEIFLGLFSIIGIFTQQAAMIFPILYF